MPILLRTMRGSFPSTTLRSPYRVSPKIQRERPSGNGMEYAPSAPHQESLKGKLGVQSILDLSCAWSRTAQESRNNAMTMPICVTHRLLKPSPNICHTLPSTHLQVSVAHVAAARARDHECERRPKTPQRDVKVGFQRSGWESWARRRTTPNSPWCKSGFGERKRIWDAQG